MNILRKLFGKPANLIECPRCLGKGRVDLNDIKRLGQELKWTPGDCAYCDGAGKVDPDIIGKVEVNEGYLVNNLPAEEKRKLFKQDKKALGRAREFNTRIDTWVEKIRQMHFEQDLSAEQITDRLIENYPQILNGKRISEVRAETLDFIKKAIYQQN